MQSRPVVSAVRACHLVSRVCQPNPYLDLSLVLHEQYSVIPCWLYIKAKIRCLAKHPTYGKQTLGCFKLCLPTTLGQGAQICPEYAGQCYVYNLTANGNQFFKENYSSKEIVKKITEISEGNYSRKESKYQMIMVQF